MDQKIIVHACINLKRTKIHGKCRSYTCFGVHIREAFLPSYSKTSGGMYQDAADRVPYRVNLYAMKAIRTAKISVMLDIEESTSRS